VRLTISQASFLNALITVGPGVYKGTGGVIDAVKCILLTSKDNKLTVAASDLDVFVVHTTECEEDEPGTVSVSYDKLKGFVSACPGKSDIKLSIGKNGLHIQSGKYKSVMPTFPSENFPVQPPVDTDKLCVNRDILRSMVDGSTFATSVSVNGRILKGVLWETVGDELRMVASDMVRLVTVHSAAEVSDKCRIIVPPRLAKLVASLGAKDDDIEIGWTDALMSARCGSTVVTGRLMAGVYPDVMRLVTQDVPIKIVCDRKALAGAIDAVVPFVDEHYVIFLIFKKDGITVKSESIAGASEVEVDAQLEVADEASVPGVMHSKLDCELLKSLLRPISTDKIAIGWSEINKPVRIEAIEGNSISVIMPMFSKAAA
jgi:DNA polymerase-3 subunit beta